MSSLYCDIFVLIFLSTKHQVNIIHFCVSILILNWTLSKLYCGGSFVDQYIESSDIEQMIFFLFDPHILLFDPHILLFVVFLFVVFYLIHIYFYLW